MGVIAVVMGYRAYDIFQKIAEQFGEYKRGMGITVRNVSWNYFSEKGTWYSFSVFELNDWWQKDGLVFTADADCEKVMVLHKSA